MFVATYWSRLHVSPMLSITTWQTDWWLTVRLHQAQSGALKLQTGHCSWTMMDYFWLVSSSKILSKLVKWMLIHHILSLSKLRTSIVLYSLVAILYHLRRVLSLYHCARFGWNHCSNFDNIKFEYFAHLAWNRQRCFFFFGGGRRSSINAIPQKAHLCTEAHHMTCRSSKSVHSACSVRSEK